MNLRDLKYLIAVADLRNFSQAADRCCVSQPTLSNQIRKLEETLGVPLFERTNKRVMTTEIGEQMVAHARRILTEVDSMHEIATSSQDPLAGKFRLGAFPTIASYLLPRLVPKIAAHLPRIKLILLEEKTPVLLEMLKRGQLDAAILALPVHDDQLAEHALFDDDFYLAVPPRHPLASKPVLQQGDLAGHKLLLLEEGHCLRDQALEVCHLAGLEEEQDFRATSMETLRQMVKAGTGITFMPAIAMQENEPGIRYIPFQPPAPSRTIGIVWRKTSGKQAVIDSLKGLYP